MEGNNAVPAPPGVLATLKSMWLSQEPKLIYVYERDWEGLQAENQRLKDLLAKSAQDINLALERMNRTDFSDHDWRAEASGLAYMICQIHHDYLFAKEAFGGDSEFLANAIQQAYRWVDGPLRDYYEATQSDGVDDVSQH